MDRSVVVHPTQRVETVKASSRFTSLYRLVVLFVALLSVVGCSQDERDLFAPHDPFPPLHVFPAWVDDDVLVFENAGAVEAGPGWAHIDPDLVGIVMVNAENRESDMIINGGIFPTTNRHVLRVAALQGLSGSILVATGTDIVALSEDSVWTARSYLTMNSRGDIYAWRSFGPEHEVGIWTWDTQSGDYAFVGAGSYPVWKPGEDTLLYREASRETEDAITRLVEFDYATGDRTVVRTFPREYGCRHLDYSPDGRRIAYFRLSLNGDDGLCVWDVEEETETRCNGHLGDGLSWGYRGIVYSNACTSVDDGGCGVLWIWNEETGESEQFTSRYEFVE